jgi:dTDP-glucose pyrophosphorylase
MIKPTLLILAAGMGSRYGKLKQMDAFGPHGETIIDYSIYDAINAGFGKIVFIIRDSFRNDFEAYWRHKLEGKVEMEFVDQSLENVPANYKINPEREKPWGTAHAIWVAKDYIKEPFGVINADDYYGVAAYSQLANFLIQSTNENKTNYAVVAYYLRNTLSEHGTVNRGVIQVDKNKHLVGVKECTKIKRNDDGIITFPDGDQDIILDENSLVSMNMWGFLPSFFAHFEDNFGSFLVNHGMELTSEYYIPTIIDYLIQNKILDVEVIDTESDWFGVTYPDDKPMVMEKINTLIQNRTYPSNLWD